MRLAVMQPYIFPYIGYFQLVNAVDSFVIYDDVNFIKQGWINRNRILLDGKEFLFTIPLEDASSFKKINEVCIHQRLYKNWKEKFYKTLQAAYLKAPFYDNVLLLIRDVLDADMRTASDLASCSITATCKYLDIPTPVSLSSAIDPGSSFTGSERVMHLCKMSSAVEYINAAGGQELYSKEDFGRNGINLSFIKTNNITYSQFDNNFVPWLSVIDVIMFNSPGTTRQMLTEYSLV